MSVSRRASRGSGPPDSLRVTGSGFSAKPAPPTSSNRLRSVPIPNRVNNTVGEDLRARPKRRRARLARTGITTPIVFVGPMAAGKTSLGKRVARELRIPFVDTDAMFVQTHGPIAEFFDRYGESEFRRIEADVIAEVLRQAGARVVALGGGAVTSANTRRLLAQHRVVLLMTTQEAVLRTANLSRRPLLRDDPDAWGRILQERQAFYEEVADVTIHTDRASKEQLIRRVVQWVGKQGTSSSRVNCVVEGTGAKKEE